MMYEEKKKKKKKKKEKDCYFVTFSLWKEKCHEIVMRL